MTRQTNKRFRREILAAEEARAFQEERRNWQADFDPLDPYARCDDCRAPLTGPSCDVCGHYHAEVVP